MRESKDAINGERKGAGGLKRLEKDEQIGGCGIPEKHKLLEVHYYYCQM